LLLCYITDRAQFPGDENARRRALLDKIAEAAACGVDLIQLREKDLPARELENLARAAMERVRRGGNSALLINSRADIALACGLHGVHMRGDDISPADVRSIWQLNAPAGPKPVISVSCHTRDDVARAAAEGADYALFAPIFEKQDTPSARPAGTEQLKAACRYGIPVLALGGVTLANARACLDAGAAGVAAIRMFQENRIQAVVQALRAEGTWS
jgi:thiamine-phosphate pyrophosphorylase